MKIESFLAVYLAALLPSAAQNVRAEPEEDPVQAAIREFNLRDRSKPNEVTVVLDAPAADEGAPALLVTGTPPENAEMIDEAAPATEPPAPAEPPAEPTEDEDIPEPTAIPPANAEPEDGLTVRVEELQTGSGAIDPSAVKLSSPFPCKPLSRPPAGWKLVESENAPELTREVELAGGASITLNVRPHLLVPEDDGMEVFAVAEPGFDTAHGYAQQATVGAILSQSLTRMDDDSKRLGAVVDQLQQLLVSLPKPEESPEPPANPNPQKP